MKETANFNYKAKLLKQHIIQARSQQQQKSSISSRNLENSANTYLKSMLQRKQSEIVHIKLQRDPKITNQISDNLKLKDYLLLRNLQKRSRSKKRLITSEVLRHRKDSSSDSTYQKGFTKTNNTPYHEKGEAKVKKIIETSFLEHTEEMKQKIIQKAEQAIKKLKDFQDYFVHSYNNKRSQRQSYSFLFQIYNQIQSLEEIHNKIGQYIKNHDRNQDSLKKDGFSQKSQRKQLPQINIKPITQFMMNISHNSSIQSSQSIIFSYE